MNFAEMLSRWIPRADWGVINLEPGLYPYVREGDGRLNRFHLRIDHDGSGVLLVNASFAVRLSPSGVFMTQRLLEGVRPEEILRDVGRGFAGARAKGVHDDLKRLTKIIETAATADARYPILNLEDPRLVGRVVPLDRPIAADVPLAEPNLLVPLLDRLWANAIAHVTILVPEAPEHAHIVRAVERAEDLGMIAGIRARARDIDDQRFVEDLATAGIDHINVYYHSADPIVHDALMGDGDHVGASAAIKSAHANEVCSVAEVALARSTIGPIDDTLSALDGLGVGAVGFFAMARGDDAPDDSPGPLEPDMLLQAAASVEELADELGMRSFWYAPLRQVLGTGLPGQVRGGPRCSGDNAIRVEPDGAVYAARGPLRSPGNLLREDWESIQARPAYASYRERVANPTGCERCPGLAICAADCPRCPDGWADDTPVEE